MEPTTIVLTISELLKLGLAGYVAYARQQGLTDEQIEAAFQTALAGLLERDPAKIPD